MQIEQLSRYDLDRVQSDFKFADLEGGHVYPKIDTLTFVFNDVTINHVIRWLRLGEHVGEFINSRFKQDGGLSPKFVFVFNNIRIEAHQIAFYRCEDPNKPMFDVLCPEVRLYLGGEALDYLRSRGIDFYDHRFVVPDLDGGRFHCTRCDWAFDFVDYKPDFLDQLIDHLNHNSLPSGRVPIKAAAIKYSVKLGSEKTVYLGSPQGSKLLRCYDKKLQYFNPDTNLWVQNPYGDCDSWYRIEWQLRNEDAHSMLFSIDQDGNVNDYLAVLKQIYTYYQFSKADHDIYSGPRPDLEFWQTFLPWDEVKIVIVQNAKYVLPKGRAEKIKTFVENSALRSLMLYFLIYGKQSFVDLCEKYLRSMDFEKDISDPSAAKRRAAFHSMCEEIYDETGMKIQFTNEKNGLFISEGRLHFDL